MFAPVYLDYNATTPVRQEVLRAMLPYFDVRFGNASSRHEYGRAARMAIDDARARVAAAVGAHPTEVVFTSGGSEANNLFIKGAAACLKPGLVVCSAVEHPCVREAAISLQRNGWAFSEWPVDGSGRLDLNAAPALLSRRPDLLSVMLANNETGVIQPVAELAALAKAQAGYIHTDAVQALGKLPIDFRALNQAGVNALSVSSHKIGGPKGIGALIVDKRVELKALISGGGHERNLRSGTENVPAIVGFGVACALATEELARRQTRLSALQARLEAGLALLGAQLFGGKACRLPNTSYFAFSHLDGETLVGKLDRAGYAVASGAACSSAQPEPSHVLMAMGVAPELARGAVRVSLGLGVSDHQVDEFLTALSSTVTQLRGLSAVAG